MKKKAKHLRKKQYKKDIIEFFYCMIFGLAMAIFFIAGFQRKEEKGMEITMLILLLIAILLIIIAKNKTEEASKKMQRTIKQYETEIENLKHLKLQEESKVATLEKKSKELQNFKDETTNIVYGKRTNDEKVDKIIEIIKERNNCR